MGRIIAIANQKGGVGKTTTVINLAACLAEKSKKVLVIDIDPQGNTSSGLGIDKNNAENTIYELLIGEAEIHDCIIQHDIKNLSIIPANMNLAGAEIELIQLENNNEILKNSLKAVDQEFDFVLMDCPPSLSVLTMNAMTAANTIIVPLQCEYYALEGLTQLMHTIELVQDRLNPELRIEGVLFTMCDVRTNLSIQVVENVQQTLKQRIYHTVIPRNVRLAEAPSHGLPITLYDRSSSGADAYRKFAEEVIAYPKIKAFKVDKNGKDAASILSRIFSKSK